MFRFPVEYNEEQHYQMNVESKMFRLDLKCDGEFDGAPHFLAHRNHVLKTNLSKSVKNAYYAVEDGQLYLYLSPVFEIVGNLRDGLPIETVRKAEADVANQYEMAKVINTYVRYYVGIYRAYGRDDAYRRNLRKKASTLWRLDNQYYTYFVEEFPNRTYFVVKASNIQGALMKIAKAFRNLDLEENPLIGNLYNPKFPKRLRKYHIQKGKASFRLFEENEAPEELKELCLNSKKVL